jgi:MSHA biogenesis protein MshK
MAESLNRAAQHLLFHGGCLFALIAAGQALALENLPDPTRPPASLHAGASTTSSAPAEPVLQSVLISPGRKVAVISGETVQVGDRIGDARVVRIAEGEVVLAHGGQPQILKLFPGLEKRRTKGGAAARETGRQQ